MKDYIFWILFVIVLVIVIPTFVGLLFWWFDWLAFFFTETLPRPQRWSPL